MEAALTKDLPGLKWVLEPDRPAAGAAPGVVLSADVLDDPAGPTPLWHALAAATECGVGLQRVVAYPYAGGFGGYPVYKFAAEVIGPRASAQRFRATLGRRLGADVDEARPSEVRAAPLGLPLPLAPLRRHPGSRWEEAFQA